MNKRIALDLLQKVSNPSHAFNELEADEEGVCITFFLYIIYNKGIKYFVFN